MGGEPFIVQLVARMSRNENLAQHVALRIIIAPLFIWPPLLPISFAFLQLTCRLAVQVVGGSVVARDVEYIWRLKGIFQLSNLMRLNVVEKIYIKRHIIIFFI